MAVADSCRGDVGAVAAAAVVGAARAGAGASTAAGAHVRAERPSASSTATGSARSRSRSSPRWCVPIRAFRPTSGSRTTATTSATTSPHCGSSRRAPARAATSPGSSGLAPTRTGCRRRRSRPRHHPQLRAHGRTMVLDERLRPQLRPAAAVHPQVGHECASRGLPRRRGCVHGAAVLPTRVRAVRRLDQLRQHALVLGAHHRQRRVRRGRDMQQQLHRAGQLRLHPDERRPRPGRPARRNPIWHR